MLSPMYEITKILCHTDKIVSRIYDKATDLTSYGRVNSVGDSMILRKYGVALLRHQNLEYHPFNQIFIHNCIDFVRNRSVIYCHQYAWN